MCHSSLPITHPWLFITHHASLVLHSGKSRGSCLKIPWRHISRNSAKRSARLPDDPSGQSTKDRRHRPTGSTFRLVRSRCGTDCPAQKADARKVDVACCQGKASRKEEQTLPCMRIGLECFQKQDCPTLKTGWTIDGAATQLQSLLRSSRAVDNSECVCS